MSCNKIIFVCNLLIQFWVSLKQILEIRVIYVHTKSFIVNCKLGDNATLFYILHDLTFTEVQREINSYF